MQKIIYRWSNPNDGNLDTLLFKFATRKENALEIKRLVLYMVVRCNKVLAKIAKARGIPVVH